MVYSPPRQLQSIAPWEGYDLEPFQPSRLVVMPTGCGKTWSARQTLAKSAYQGLRGIYLSPLKALAQEQLQALRTEFPNLKVNLFTGEVASNPRESQILVATHEKFNIYLKQPKHHLSWLAQVGLMVVDEIHLLADRERGGRLESLLVRSLDVNPFIQVLGLSATLSNKEEIAGWLNAEVISGGERPVPLVTQYMRYKTEAQKQEMLIGLLEEARRAGGQTLIFVATRRRAEAIEEVLRSHAYRVRHHHSGLWPQERQEVEGRFRAGQVEALVATPTLEMGVNLPVRRVVLYDTYQFNGEGFDPLSVQSFLQRIGRAGRPGLDPTGEAYVLLPAWADDAPYRRGVPERVMSRLGRPEVLAQFLLDGVEAGLAQSFAELKVLYGRSLHAHQKAEVDLEGTLALLLEGEFVREHDEQENDAQGQRRGLRVTYLGRIAARLSLSPAELMLSRRILELGAVTPYDLILMVTLWPSLSPRIWCAWEDVELIREGLEALPGALLDVPIDRFPVSRRMLLSGAKTVALLSQEESVAALAKRFGVYPVEVDQLRRQLPETLMALAQVLDPLGFPQLEQVAKDAAAIAQSGLPLEAVALLDLRGIGPVLAARLYEAGLTPTILPQAQPEAIAQIQGISLKGARRLLRETKEIVPRRYPTHRLGTGQGMEQCSWNHAVDPYRLRRSLELKHRSSVNPALRTVFGGSEERQVLRKLDQYRCSCPDYDRYGRDCKHILYCKRLDGDAGVLGAIADLPSELPTSLRGGLAMLWQSANRRVPW